MSFGSGAISSRRGFSPLASPTLNGERVSHHAIGPLIAATDCLGLVFLAVIAGFGYDSLVKGIDTAKPMYFGLGGLAATLTVIMLHANGLYERSLVLGRHANRSVLKTWLTTFGILAIAGFLFGVSYSFSRGALIIYFFTGGGFLLVSRQVAAGILRRAINAGTLPCRRVILIGDCRESSPAVLRKSMSQHGYLLSYSYLFDASKGVAELASEIPWRDVIDIGRSGNVDEVMLAVRWSDGEHIEFILNMLRVLPISVRLLPDESVATLFHRPIADIGMARTVELQREPLKSTQRLLKRAFDIVLAIGGLILLAPLMMSVAALIKLDTPGPVFFGQTRVGFNGSKFRIWKFRTMRTLDDGEEIKQATRDDDRVTRVGRWLRATSVDELPQLLNVLIGDMSLVGPRPHAVAHDNQYDAVIANYALRRHVKPGITGWAQVCGFRGETPTVDLMLQRVEHDLWYINNWSFWLDSLIVMRTAVALMRPQNAY